MFISSNILILKHIFLQWIIYLQLIYENKPSSNSITYQYLTGWRVVYFHDFYQKWWNISFVQFTFFNILTNCFEMTLHEMFNLHSVQMFDHDSWIIELIQKLIVLEYLYLKNIFEDNFKGFAIWNSGQALNL